MDDMYVGFGKGVFYKRGAKERWKCSYFKTYKCCHKQSLKEKNILNYTHEKGCLNLRHLIITNHILFHHKIFRNLRHLKMHSLEVFGFLDQFHDLRVKVDKKVTSLWMLHQKRCIEPTFCSLHSTTPTPVVQQLHDKWHWRQNQSQEIS